MSSRCSVTCHPVTVSDNVQSGNCKAIVIPTRAYIPQTTKPPTQRKNPTYRISKRFVTVFSVAIRLKWSFQAVLTQWSSENVSKYDRRPWATPFKYTRFAFSIAYGPWVMSKCEFPILKIEIVPKWITGAWKNRSRWLSSMRLMILERFLVGLRKILTFKCLRN